MFRKPENIILQVFVFLLPTQIGLHFWPNWTKVFGIRVDYLSPTLYLTDILAFLLLGLWLYKSVKNFQFSIFNFQSIYKYLIFIGLFVYFNISTALVWEAALFKWVKVTELVLVSLYFFKNVKLKNITNTLVYSLIFFSLIGVLQFISQSTLGGIFYYLGERSFSSETLSISKAYYLGNFLLRPYSTFSHPNSFAGFLLVGSVLVFSKKRPLSYFSFIVVFLTASKAAAMSLFSYFFKNYSRAVFFLAIISGIGSLFVVQNFKPSNYGESIGKRIESIQVTREFVSRNFLFGVGLNNFFETTKSLQPVHNIFLLVLVETGIIGLALFLFLLIKALNNSLKNENWKLTIALLVIVLSGSVDHYWLTLQQNQLLFSVVLGLSLKK